MRALITGTLMAVALCAQAQENRDVLYQVSTIDALLSGIYDSMATVDDVLDHGGFGLGTFDSADGEMMVLDGIVYQATFDGSMNVMPPSTGTPFMAVTHFVPDRELDADLGGDNGGDLKAAEQGALFLMHRRTDIHHRANTGLPEAPCRDFR